MSVKVRFAPSPTGYLHLGNIRTALVNWLFSRKSQGEFLLRIDDTDHERSKPEYVEAIKEDLTWLGLSWDGYETQSSREGRYNEVIEKLKAEGKLYPCYETPEELEFKRRRQISRKKPPLYDREALSLTEEKKKAYEAEGRKPHWRFKLSPGTISWVDLVRGEVTFEAENLSDPVLIRADGTPLYTLPSVVDDIDMGITHVVRGEDHLSNTATQVQLIEALGANSKSFTFSHLSLMTELSGEGFSKRLGSLSIGALRKEGYAPMAINSLLATIGTSEDVDAYHDLETLIEKFDFKKFSRSAFKFDPKELEALNAKIVHNTPFDLVQKYLKESGIEGVTQDFWRAVSPNLKKFQEVREWVHVCQDDIETVVVEEDRDFIKVAATKLPESSWEIEDISSWIEAVKQETGRKGKGLFMPLRLAITGQEHGPELKPLLHLIGLEKVRGRLSR